MRIYYGLEYQFNLYLHGKLQKYRKTAVKKMLVAHEQKKSIKTCFGIPKKFLQSNVHDFLVNILHFRIARRK